MLENIVETKMIMLAQVLQQKRKDKNLTQKEIAKKLGIETKYYKNIEIGIIDVDFTLFIHICNVLQVSPIEVLKLCENKQFD